MPSCLPVRRLTPIVSLVVFVALLGADAASAAERNQHGADGSDVRSVAAAVGAGRLAAPVVGQARPAAIHHSRSEKRARTFIKRQAMVVANAQPAVFPNARVTGRKPWAVCSEIHSRLWLCAYHVAMYERSTIDPPAEYDPEWPIQQRTVRFCGAPNHEVLRVRRARSSRKLRVVGGWRMACPLEQDRIDQWNLYGPDWAGPNVTEPTAYEQITGPLPGFDEAPDGLLPPPSGAPEGVPLGPLSLTPYGSASRKAHAAWDTFLGCSYWNENYMNSGYWVYGCFWRPDSLPGASPGIFNNVINMHLYYWAGDRDIYGRALGRLYYSGIAPQTNYVHG